MTREEVIAKEHELLLRRHNKAETIKLKVADVDIPENIVDILSQKTKRTSEQEKCIQQFRKKALEQLQTIGLQIKKERLEKARKTREANLEKDPRYVKHFGIWVNTELPSARISRKHYAKINPRSSVVSYSYAKHRLETQKDSPLIVDDESRSVFYTAKYCLSFQKKCLENFDINMRKFSLLDYESFNSYLEKFANRRKLKQVFSLEEDLCTQYPWQLSDVDGFVYMMVMDEYKQAYIGITYHTVNKRIREHWCHSREFDRLIFGEKETSILSVDSFGPLDTTRLFLKPYSKNLKTPLEIYEYKCINAFDSKYLLNRL